MKVVTKVRKDLEITLYPSRGQAQSLGTSVEADKRPGWLELLYTVCEVRGTQYWPFLSVWLLEMAVAEGH